ncbi:hypothetical protein Mgra_00009195 [Meloidogyne graminicola]|uniref:Uncharacterized protein n=1 Tax=Meloidogyne graminicola TaxID=189291 RepID=A0A8S9ZDN1_9BILA|nr:hypothetical protein Mgra_00009195 [Meloidogyne graminicola]
MNSSDFNQSSTNQQTSGTYAPRVIKKPWYITQDVLSQRIKNEKRPVSLSKKEKREYKRTQIAPPILTEEEYLNHLKEQEEYFSAKNREAEAKKLREKHFGGGSSYWTTIKQKEVEQTSAEDWEKRQGGWDNIPSDLQ